MREVIALIIALILLILISLTAHAGIYPEKVYQEAWCKKAGGVMEVVLDDKTRVDCLTTDYAVEMDFAPKWAEAIGQSLHYARKTGRLPAIVLIMEGLEDIKYLERLQGVTSCRGIKLFIMEPKDIGEPI